MFWKYTYEKGCSYTFFLHSDRSNLLGKTLKQVFNKNIQMFINFIGPRTFKLRTKRAPGGSTQCGDAVLVYERGKLRA